MNEYSIWVSEPDQELRLVREPTGSDPLPLTVAKAAMGGEIFWFADKEIQDSVPDEVWDDFESRVSAAPIAMPSVIVGKLRRLARLHEEAAQIEAELIASMDERYDLGLADDCSYLVPPLSELDTSDFVYGEVKTTPKGKRGLYVDGALVATETHPGYYVDQSASYYGDSYTGLMYLKLWGDGRFVKIPFET